ncbi:MAG: SdrD B-like domain-containing protein, partial [Clostridia bacterium]
MKNINQHKRSVYNITANTNEAGYNIREHFKYGMEEIKHINLGLYGREQPDLAVIKDVQNAIVTINGYEHTYNYADRFSDQEYEKGFNMGIKFKNERGTQAYTRAIYKSDVTYVGNPERELKVKVTYKIRVINESTDLKTKVNSIVDYYDSGYTISAIGTGVNAQGNITGELKHQDGGYNEKYKKTVINTSDIIEPQNFTDVYVQFSMDRTTILNIMNKKEPLDNITEINSYSVFDKDGKVYAGIDKDSAPGNTIPGNVSTYEDDTDKAPAFILEPKDDREMGGTIFEDNAISSGVGKIREGNGLLNEGEHGIEDVEVTLKETSGAGVADKTVKTDVNGNFIFAAYIPGDYIITYTWGGQTYTEQGTSNVTTYTVQNYKGTVFNQEAHKGVEWYKQLEPRYTDATDNYNKDEQAPKGSRQQIDNEMKDVTYANKTKYTYKKLDSTTPKMGFGVEYDSLISDSAEDKFVYKVNNIDFGLIKRATQSIQMNKSVDTIKVTFANGTIMADAKIVEDKDGKKYLEGNKSGMTYMEPSSTTVPSNGFIKIELDNELLQGSTLELSYKLKTTNISELDYLSEEFYKYGTIQGNIVTITPSKIIDYLDKDWGYDQEKNKEGGWIEKTLDEIKQMQQNGMFGEAVYGNESDIQNTRILYTEKLKEAKIEPTKSESVM